MYVCVCGGGGGVVCVKCYGGQGMSTVSYKLLHVLTSSCYCRYGLSSPLITLCLPGNKKRTEFKRCMSEVWTPQAGLCSGCLLDVGSLLKGDKFWLFVWWWFSD